MELRGTSGYRGGVSSTVSVVIPPAFRGPTSGAGTVSVQGATVREALEAVENGHPGFGRQLFAAEGRVHSFIRIFRNGDQVDASELDQPVAEADEIEIVSAIGGG